MTGIEGLDTLRSPTISPAFNLAIRTDNRRDIRRFWKENSLRWCCPTITWSSGGATGRRAGLLRGQVVHSGRERFLVAWRRVHVSAAAWQHGLRRARRKVGVERWDEADPSGWCLVGVLPVVRLFKLGELANPCNRFCVSWLATTTLGFVHQSLFLFFFWRYVHQSLVIVLLFLHMYCVSLQAVIMSKSHDYIEKWYYDYMIVEHFYCRFDI